MKFILRNAENILDLRDKFMAWRVMFKRVEAQYEGVISMVVKLVHQCCMVYSTVSCPLSSITAIGCNVVVSLVDGHSANAKFYKSELCCDKPTSLITHPLDENKKLFLHFDSVHIFKCLYNNFQWQVLFQCPTFDGTDVSANFHHISELYETELSKPVNMAYTLTHECLNPNR